MIHPAVEAGFAAINRMIPAFVEEKQLELAATARGLLEGYHACWGDTQAQYQLLACEKTYLAEHFNPATKCNSRTYRVGGKLDKLVREGDWTVLVDHKTVGSSTNISDPGSPYWRQLEIGCQASHYNVLLELNGIRVHRIMWDVIRKPNIRAKQVKKGDAAIFLRDGFYCGRRFPEETLLVFEESGKETPGMFQARLFQACQKEPELYFQRQAITRTLDELNEYCQELWQISKEMRKAELKNHHFRNPDACMTYNSPCTYLPICSGHSTTESGIWGPRESINPELDAAHGLPILSYSRIKCYQTCRRKHFYRFLLGIDRVDRKESEALYFGNLFHAALDAYWNVTCKRISDGDEQGEPSVTETDGSERGKEELAEAGSTQSQV
jgi:hypothetical protein